MNKRGFILIFCAALSFFSYGQTPPCEKLAKQMEADTKGSIWSYDSIMPETYYCLGKYFAQRDIDKKIYLIQTYGYPESANPCHVCHYKSFGFSFHYHWDIIEETITQFIEGYNEISKAYLKAKIGDSAFRHLDDIPKEYFNPREVLSKNLTGMDHQKFFIADIINDTTINVKLRTDSLFKDNPQFLTKIIYHISDCTPTNISAGQGEMLDNKRIKEEGFRVTEKSNDKYWFTITFDFKNVSIENKYCWCPLISEQEYTYKIPLKVKQ